MIFSNKLTVNKHKKHLLLDLRIEEIILKEEEEPTDKISLYRLVKEKAKTGKKVEA